jgi:glycosyltransferase involved in cell wall biosynthesis
MAGRALFIYTSESLTGLTAKAMKIEAGFRSAGYEPKALYFGRHQGWLRRAGELLTIWCRAGAAILSRRYEVVLIRYAYYFAPIYLVARVVGGNVQIEVNSDAAAEMRNRRQYVRAWMDGIAMKVACAAASRVHAVSRFLATTLQRRFPKAEVVFTPNFVVDEYYSERVCSDAGPTNIVFLGNTAQVWHGIPLFLSVIAGNPCFREQCRVHLVGHCSSDVEDLIEKLNIGSIVVKHGFVVGEAKHQLMSGMHIGISGFALGAIGLEETTGIKVGEYLHAGIPVILGYADPAIDPDSPFSLMVKMDADPSETCKDILEFARRVRGSPGISTLAHEYAKRKLLVGQYIESILAPERRSETLTL